MVLVKILSYFGGSGEGRECLVISWGEVGPPPWSASPRWGGGLPLHGKTKYDKKKEKQ